MTNSIEEAKELLIKRIKEKGFPIGFGRDCADGGYVIVAMSETKIRCGEYAAEEHGQNIENINKLSLVDLAYLLEEGETETKELNRLIESCDEAEEDFNDEDE